MSKKRRKNDFFVSSGNTPHLREKTIIIGMSDLLSGANCIVSWLVCAKGSEIQRIVLLLGIIMLLMVPISVTDNSRENRGTFATICACLNHLAFSGMLAYVSTPWWMAVYAVEVFVIAIVAFISFKHPRRYH